MDAPFIKNILNMGESIGSQKEAKRGQENVNFLGGDIGMSFPRNRILSCVLGKILVLLLEGVSPELATQRYIEEFFLFKGWYAFCTVDEYFRIVWARAELFEVSQAGG
jgi:hypothetical protein